MQQAFKLGFPGEREIFQLGKEREEKKKKTKPSPIELDTGGNWLTQLCICSLQNSHDRETCARSLRATQESRQSPGAFPPAVLCGILQQQQHHQRANHVAAAQQQRCCSMNQAQRGTSNNPTTNNNTRPHRPASLDIGMARRCPVACTRAAAASASSPITTANSSTTPSSAPAVCTTRGFFDDCTGDSNCLNKVQNAGNEAAGFELNVNVACSPAGNRGTHPRTRGS